MAVTAAQIKKVVKVASGIIYSQEGNYGSVNRNDNDHQVILSYPLSVLAEYERFYGIE